MVQNHNCLIIEVNKVEEKTFQLTLFSPSVVKEAKPGSFVHLKVSELNSPLLRRAFSIYSVNSKKKTLDLLFRVIGVGTEILSQKKPGESLELLAPLGKSFSYKEKKKKKILVAGGMGIAPLNFLLEKLLYQKEKPILFFGAKNQKDLIGLENLKKKPMEKFFSSEDGSVGCKGMITDVFERELKSNYLTRAEILVYACGPVAMLKQISELSLRYNFKAEISLENHMPCGVGACFGCAVKIKNGNDFIYKRVCSDGPVFDAQEVILD
jgi:dihydroorotate dehydrogenase electron transfer subunit